MEQKSLKRRDFLRLSAFGAAGALLAACAPQVIEKTVEVEKVVTQVVEVESTVEVEVEKIVTAQPEPGEKVTFDLWAQDWGPLLSICDAVKTNLMAADPNLDFVVRPIPWGDLTTKLVPACAAGTEGDGFFSYTYLWRQVDTSALLLPLSPIIDRAELEAIVYPEVLDELQDVGQELYFIPILSGFDSATVTTNQALLPEGFDPSTVATWEELVEVAKGATVVDDSGLMMQEGFLTGGFALAAGFCLSQGVSFYDKEARQFRLTIPEMEYGLTEVWKLYNEHKTSSLDFELGAQDAFGAGMVAMVNYGAYTLSGYESSYPDGKWGQFVVPPLAGIEPADQRFWQNALFGFSLSRRLGKDAGKMVVGSNTVRSLVAPETLLLMLDYYSGGVCSPGVYTSPNLGDHKYGLATKDYGDRLWRNTVIVGNVIQEPYDIITAEVQRAVRNEVSVAEALSSLNDQLNVLEAEAIARKTGGA